MVFASWNLKLDTPSNDRTAQPWRIVGTGQAVVRGPEGQTEVRGERMCPGGGGGGGGGGGVTVIRTGGGSCGAGSCHHLSCLTPGRRIRKWDQPMWLCKRTHSLCYLDKSEDKHNQYNYEL